MEDIKTSTKPSAILAQTQYAAAGSKKIAYRSMGSGDAIILCNRFRGIMDTWDPAFLDALAKKFNVIIFDYSGIGLSEGTLPTEIATVADDVKDLASFLNLTKFIVAGWSYGGMVAQTFAVRNPDMVSHLILLGTKPAGNNAAASEDLFFTHALKPVNDLSDEIVMFFEPESRLSRKAAKRTHKRIAERTEGLDVMVTPEKFPLYQKGAEDFTTDSFNTREKLGALNIPILVLCGDHDIAFPVENWYALTKKLPNMFLMLLPQAGHGPHHQYPKLSVKYMRSFIKSAKL